MRITRIHCLLLSCLLLCSFAINAKTVKGKVRDEAGLPLQGVIVALSGSNNSVSKVSNTEGEFAIEVPDGEQSLVFTRVGYKRQTIDVSKKEFVEIYLESVTAEEVVVTGYVEQKRANVLGNVGVIKASEVQDLSVANIATALVGKVPGVGITQTSGKPGSTTKINIRNNVSFSSSGSTDPLYVIDGIALDVSIGNIMFNNLDASLIESITFLKDAAAAIYGSRATNGVILVTTKKGKKGKPRITYSGNYGLSYAPRQPEVLSAYDQVSLLNQKYKGLIADDQFLDSTKRLNLDPNNIYTDAELEYLKTHNYDNLSDMWQSSHLQRHYVNVSGGSDDITYFAGANYFEQNGNFANTDAKRIGVRFGSTAKISDNLSATITFSIDNSVQSRLALKSPSGIASGVLQIGSDQVDEMNGSFQTLLLTPQWYPSTINGLPAYTGVYSQNIPALQKSNSYAKGNAFGASINGSVEYKVPHIKGLSLRVNYGLNKRSDYSKQYYPPYSTYQFQTTGLHNSALRNSFMANSSRNVIFGTDTITTGGARVAVNNGDQISITQTSTTSYTFNQGISYTNKFGNHDISLLALAEQSETSSQNASLGATGIIIPGVDQIWNFSTQTTDYTKSYPTESGRASYLGRVNYSFKDKYLFEGTFRADGSLSFRPANRWGYFHSEAVGWKISEEKFFKDNVKFVNSMKFRFQLGYTGNDAISTFRYLDRFDYSANLGYLYGSSYSTGALLINFVPNYDLSWEKTKHQNLGMDVTMFNNKVDLSLNVYQRLTYDMLVTPTTGGATNLVGSSLTEQNYGKVRSKGIEGTIGYNIKAGGVTLNLTAILGAYDNRIVKTFQNFTSDTGYLSKLLYRTDRGIQGYIYTGMFRTQNEVNAYLEQHPGYLINGQIPRPGFMNFKDINGDNKIDAFDITQLTPRSSSVYNWAFNIAANWKTFRLSTNIGFQFGGSDIYDKAARTAPTEVENALSFWKDSWTPENPNAKYPAIYAPYASEVSTFWIVSTTTLRVNNMTLSYSMPSKISERYKIPEFRAYVTGTNLWVLVNSTPYKDPSANNSMNYPILRTYTFGVNITL